MKKQLHPIYVGMGAPLNPFTGIFSAIRTALTPGVNRTAIAMAMPHDLQDLYVDNAHLVNLYYSPSTGQIWAQHGTGAVYLNATQRGVALDGSGSSYTSSRAGGPGNLPTGHTSNGARFRFYPTGTGSSGGTWRQF
jgi:hypothetical protein